MAEGFKVAVADASFLLAFLLPDENIPIVEDSMRRFMIKELSLISVQLLPFEIFNCLKTAIKRRRITNKFASELGSTFLDFGIDLKEIDFRKTLDLTERENLSFYDASYVFLARSKGIPLLTLDGRMQKLARI